MLQGFRQFLLRGNLVDLAVAFVIGAAFSGLVTSFTQNLVMPIIGIFGGVPDFSALTFSINGSVFKYGAFITALLSFVLTAAVVYFFVVRPFTALLERFKREEKPPVAEPTNEEKLLAEIRDVLKAQRP